MIVQTNRVFELKTIFKDDYDRIRFGFFGDIKSEHTRAVYENDLLQFGGFLQKYFPETKLIEVKREHIVAFKNFLIHFGGLKVMKASDRTINRKLACLSKFYTYLGEQGIVSSNPCQFVKRIEGNFVVETDFLSTEEVRAIFMATSDTTLTGSMHRALLMTMFSTGMRVSELTALKVENYKLISGARYFSYTAKGNKKVLKKVVSKCREAIETYLEHLSAERLNVDQESYLFRPTRNQVGSTNKRLDRKSVRRILEKYAKLAGIEKKISPHVSRTTVTGELLEKRWDIYKVAEYMGHSELKMTIAYDKKKASLKNDVEEELEYLI